MENKFRYPGARPFYEEDWYMFFGRDRDKLNLANLIELEQVVVLFGKSGYGKTSLLNAAVIPYLQRFEQHEIRNIRLIEPAEGKKQKYTPLELVISHLQRTVPETDLVKEKLNLPIEIPEDRTAVLWYYIKSLELNDPENKAITLVFDQFEELRHFSEVEIEEFGRALNSILFLQAPKSVRDLIAQKLESDPKFFSEEERRSLLKKVRLKLVFSLHHNRLNLLDKLKEFIPSIFNFTYELKPLTETQALEALHKPAKLEGEFKTPVFTYSKEASDYIISSLKAGANEQIETFQLQLLAQHAEEKILAKKVRADKLAKFKKNQVEPVKQSFQVEAEDLDDPNKIYRKHYKRAIALLPYSKRYRARNLVEKGLIIDGNRVPLPEPVIRTQYQVSEESLTVLQEKSLLRSEKNTVQGTSWELSHDTLINAVQKNVEERKKRMIWIILILLLLIIGALLAWIYYEKTKDDGGNGIIINPLVTATVDPVSGPKDFEFTFTYRITDSLSKVKVKKVLWDFGDDLYSKADSVKYKDVIIKHAYKEVKTYNAYLIVYTSDNIREEKVSINVTDNDTIPEPVPPPIEVRNIEINANPPGGRAPLTIQFSINDTLSGSEGEYQWTMNDSVFSTAQNPSYEFIQEGSYRVELEVPESANFTVAPKDITIGAPEHHIEDHHDSIISPQLPVAVALPEKAEGIAPFEVEFRGDSSTVQSSYITYYWELDDNISSDLANPSYIFKKDGDYKVVLTVIDSLENESRDTVFIKVKPDKPPIASAVATYNSGARSVLTENNPVTINGVAPFRVRFDASNSKDDVGLSKFEWDFGDGVTAMGEIVEHTFIEIRKHDMSLTAYDSGGQKASVAAVVEVEIEPKDPIDNYRTWMQRFTAIQNEKLNKIRDETNSWRKHIIAPDSVNLIAVYFDTPSNIPLASDNELPHLLFFFTSKGDSKLFKFRSEIDTENMAEMRSERFNFNSLINVTSRNAQKNEVNNSALKRKFMLPDENILSFGSSTYKNLAGLFKENKSAKTLNFYYTVFPYSELTEEAQKEIDTYYLLLGEPK